MTLLNSVLNISTKPFETAFNTTLFNDQVNCGKAIQARLLYVAQLITSIIALPIILLLGLASLAVRACQGEGKDAANELWFALRLHVAVIIPTSVVGIVAPLEAAKITGAALLKCAIPMDSLVDEVAAVALKRAAEQSENKQELPATMQDVAAMIHGMRSGISELSTEKASERKLQMFEGMPEIIDILKNEREKILFIKIISEGLSQ